MRGALAGVTTVLVLGIGSGIGSAADDVVVRTSTSLDEAWVGQRVLVSIEVLGADGWAQIKDLGDIEIPGTYVMRTESQGVRLNETIGRTSYTGQRYQVSVYCQQPGHVEVPALPVTVTVKQWGFNAGETPHEVTIPGVSFMCKVPPGAEGIRGLISTTRLDADQAWSSKPDTVAPGDAITRSVTLRAEDVSGMAFPPMRHPEIEGVGVYPGQPSVADSTGRGSLRGERVETVTYVCETPGEVTLPGIVLPWWDIDDEELKRVELSGLTIDVVGKPAPDPAEEVAMEPAEDPQDRVRLVLAVAVFVGIGLWFGRRFAGRYLQWRRALRESEAAYFRRVFKALRVGDAGSILSAVMNWLDRLDPGVRPARLDTFLREHGDDRGREAASTLMQCFAAGETFSESADLSRGLKRARHRYRQSRRVERRAAGVLPELNRNTPT
jgi:hypothetical protein